MLILERQVDEAILIGNDIRVMVVRIRGQKVKLGIAAPGEIPIRREENAEQMIQDPRVNHRNAQRSKW